MTSEICSGLRILDLSRTWTGALATLLLADAGAEVIKIEAPGGDPTWNHYASPLWHRGKKSAFLDLKTTDGRDTLNRLASRSDVLLHTLMPGADKRLGADYETLREVNPALVYCAVSGFGPLKGLEGVKGYDAVVAAHTGRFYVFRKQLAREAQSSGPFPSPASALACSPSRASSPPSWSGSRRVGARRSRPACSSPSSPTTGTG